MSEPSPQSYLAHLAIIMDGNGRWAEKRGLARNMGHKAGTETARAIVQECLDMGIPYLTLFTFSQENWKRPADEVSHIFGLLVDYISKEIPTLASKGVRLHILGETAGLPFATRKALDMALNHTRDCSRMVLNLALNYSGREELARACRRCVQDGLAPEAITPEAIADRLYTNGQPDPDLIIRTSGELRLSNFLLFQSAHSELYFTDTLWPDFSPEELCKAVESFKIRKRRFGGLDALNIGESSE